MTIRNMYSSILDVEKEILQLLLHLSAIGMTRHTRIN